MQYENLVSTVQKQLDVIDSLIDAVGQLAKMHDELRWRVRFLETTPEELSWEVCDPLEETDHAA